MTKVPEDRRVFPFYDEELTALALKLAGNKAFGVCRSQHYNWRLGDIIDDMINETASPSEYLEKFDKFTSALRIITDLMAQLKRDGKTRLVEELKNALEDRNYVLMGETVPLEQTVPITLLMLEPEKTLPLLKWFAGGKIPATYIEEDVNSTRGILESYLNSLDGLPTSYEKSIRLSNEGDRWLDESSCTIAAELQGLADSCFMFFGKDQGQVLSMIDRKDQHRVTTWQINAPSILVGMSPGFSIGFHEVGDHEIWLKRYPTLASVGASHGYGAFFILEPILNKFARLEYLNQEIWVHSTSTEGEGYHITQKPGLDQRIVLSPFVSEEVRFTL